MSLLAVGLTDVELPRLTIMVGKAVRARPGLVARHRRAVADIAFQRMRARPGPPAVGFVIDAPFAMRGLHMAVLLVIADRAALGRVHRDLGEIRPAQPFQLRVQIGKIAALQQGIIGKVDTWDHIGGAKGDLFSFGKEILDRAVKPYRADDLHRAILFGDQLGRVQHVKGKAVGKGLIKQLHAQFPFRKIPPVDGIPQIAAVPVGVCPVAFDRLVPKDGLQAHFGLPVKFDEGGYTFGGDEAKGMNAKPLHCGERARDRAVRHRPHDCVHRLGGKRDEIPEVVMCCGRLREIAVGFGFHGMDQIWKFDRVLNEKHRCVIAHKIPVSGIGIEFDCKPPDVARQIGRTFAAHNGGKPHKNFGLFANFGKGGGLGHLGHRAGAGKGAMRAVATGVNHTFGDAFMVEVKDFLAQCKIFQQRRAGAADAQGVLVVRDHHALRGGQTVAGHVGMLVNFTSGTGGRDQVVQVGGLGGRCHGRTLPVRADAGGQIPVRAAGECHRRGICSRA